MSFADTQIACDIGGFVTMPTRHVIDASQGHRIWVAEISERCIHISLLNKIL